MCETAAGLVPQHLDLIFEQTPCPSVLTSNMRTGLSVTYRDMAVLCSRLTSYWICVFGSSS